MDEQAKNDTPQEEGAPISYGYAVVRLHLHATWHREHYPGEPFKLHLGQFLSDGCYHDGDLMMIEHDLDTDTWFVHGLPKSAPDNDKESTTP